MDNEQRNILEDVIASDIGDEIRVKIQEEISFKMMENGLEVLGDDDFQESLTRIEEQVIEFLSK